MSRLPKPGERARVLRSEAMDRWGATGKTGVVLDWLSECVSRAHAAGPILDPSAYRSGVPNLRDQERVLTAAQTLKGELEAVWDGGGI